MLLQNLSHALCVHAFGRGVVVVVVVCLCVCVCVFVCVCLACHGAAVGKAGERGEVGEGLDERTVEQPILHVLHAHRHVRMCCGRFSGQWDGEARRLLPRHSQMQTADRCHGASLA